MKQKACLIVILLLAFALCLTACDGGVVSGLLGTETECDFCGETKKCKEKTLWGEEYLICNDCQKELGEAVNAEPASGLDFYKQRDNEKGIYYYQVEGPGTNLDKDLVIPATYKDLPVMGIAGGAFEDCAYLTSVVIPKSVTFIGGSAFSGCKNITSIIIPDSVEFIYNRAFSDCDSLQKVVIGDGVKEINEFAFGGCTALTELKIGKSVEMIERVAFGGCTNLNEVEILNEEVSVDETAFGGCDALATVKIGKNITITYGEETGEIRISDVSKLLTSQACRILAPAAYHVYVDGKLLTELVIPDGITEIPRGTKDAYGYMFGFCSGWIGLESVTIPGTVERISDWAFYRCESLKNLIIGEGVKEIGSYAFGYCDGLTSVTFPASVNCVCGGVFAWCDNLSSVVFENTEGWHAHPWGRVEKDVTDPKYNAEKLKFDSNHFPWYNDEDCSRCNR